MKPSKLLSLTELRELFCSLICDAQIDLTADLTQYNPSVHKGVYCRYHEQNHVALKSNWEQFLKTVNSSALNSKEKNEFIHAGLSSGVLRAAFSQVIEEHPSWEETTIWFTQQKLMEADFEQHALQESREVLEANELQDLSIIFLPSIKQEVHVVTEDLEEFSRKLELKKESAVVERHVPQIVFAHFETLMDREAQSYIRLLNARPAQTHEHLIYQFHDLMVEKQVYLEDEYHRFVPAFNVAYFHPLTGDQYLVLKTEAAALAEELLHHPAVSNGTKFLEDLRATEVDLFNFCLPHMQVRPEWNDAEKIMKRFALIQYAFHEAVCEQSLSYSETSKRFVYCRNHVNRKKKHFVDEAVYQQYLQDLFENDRTEKLISADFVVTFNMVKRFIRETVQEDMITLNRQVLAAKEREAAENYEHEHLVPVRELNQAELLEFYVCGRKNRYETATEAWAGCVIFDGKAESTVYSCTYCNGFHYGIKALRTPSRAEKVAGGREWYLFNVKRANKFVTGRTTVSS